MLAVHRPTVRSSLNKVLEESERNGGRMPNGDFHRDRFGAVEQGVAIDECPLSGGSNLDVNGSTWRRA
jgi:hypothetical protein